MKKCRTIDKRQYCPITGKLPKQLLKEKAKRYRKTRDHSYRIIDGMLWESTEYTGKGVL